VDNKDQDYEAYFEAVVAEIQQGISTAVSEIASNYSDLWEDAERFYGGESDVKAIDNRSKYVETVVRDGVNLVIPAILEMLEEGDAIVDYIDVSGQRVLDAKAQSVAMTQLFYKSGGFAALCSALYDAAMKKAGVLKLVENTEPKLEHYSLSSVAVENINALKEKKVAVNLEVYVNEFDNNLFDIEFDIISNTNAVTIEYVPVTEFFIDANATCVKDASVVGQCSFMTVGTAISHGFDTADWSQWITSEVTAYPAERQIRTGNNSTNSNYFSEDVTAAKVKITEVYYRGNLEEDPEALEERLYCFWFVGDNQDELLTWKQVSYIPYYVGALDWRPDSVFGLSIFDILKEVQNDLTSLSRATADNAHAANSARVAADPMKTNFVDLMNQGIGHPIRTRGQPMIQPLTVQPMVHSMLPLLEHKKHQGHTKIGITDAAFGLSSEAMQSTDRAAVANTIAKSMLRIKAMARYFIERAIIPLFHDLLIASKTLDLRYQVKVNGSQTVDIATSNFSSAFVATPGCGLGNASKDEKIISLQFILAQQKELMVQLGPANGIVTISNVLACVADLARLQGIKDISRYFTPISFEQERKMKADMDAASQQPDPGEAMLAIEQVKSEATIKKTAMELASKQELTVMQHELEIAKERNRDDLERDKLDQSLFTTLLDQEHQQKMTLKQLQASQDKDRSSNG